MDNINYILKILRDYVNSKTVLEPPTKAEIIDKLCTLGVKLPGVDNTDIVSKIVKSVINSVKKYENYSYSKNKDINIKFLSAINGGYHLIKVLFNEESVFEGISVIIPVKGDKLITVIPFVYKHLLNNRISFSSRISMFNRSDNLTIDVYNKKDAVSLINFCNDKFDKEMGIVNPFVAKIGNVGVCKELNGRSYNEGIAGLLNEYIEECILNQRKKSYDVVDFQNFVNEKYESADNCLDKNMYYIASISLYSIITNNNILKYLKSGLELRFDYENYMRYQVINMNGDNEYLFNGNVVNRKNNYLKYVELQAHNCLNKIYEEQYQRSFAYNQVINNKFTSKLLEQIDYLLKQNSSYNVKVSYNDDEIIKLLPYLYGYVAHIYKSCNIGEVKKLIDTVKRTMIIEKGFYNNKYYYLEGSQKIISSVPVINISLGTVVIDIIDLSSMMANINIIRKGKKESYLNVYVKLNYDLLKDNVNNNGRIYRYKVARELLNKKRNEEALERRKTDFSALFLNV